MAKASGSPVVGSPPAEQWARWVAALTQARHPLRLRSILRGVASDLASLLADGAPLNAFGVRVLHIRLDGRDGGIHDRWDDKAVLVDVRVPLERQGQIVAHEVGHLMLGYVNRSGVVRLPRQEQERLCDEFAGWLLTDLDDRQIRAGDVCVDKQP